MAKTAKKAPKAKTKKVEIRRELDGFAYARPGAETWSTGYATRWNAKRGAQRHFKGWKLVFVNKCA